MSSRPFRILSLGCASAVCALFVDSGEAIAAEPARTGPPTSGLGPDPDWIERARRHISAREYRASANGAGLQAPNRRHDLRTYFEPGGIRVHDRTAPDEPRLLALALVGIGRGERLASVPPGRVESDGARVEIHRPGLVEWYLNSPEGLEQGFTLAERPPGKGALVLALSLSGSTATLAGDALRIETPTGRRLAFGKLAAEDAAGAPAPARFELRAGGRIALVIDDAAAAYPLAIDPLLSASPDAQLESNQAGALFGGAVAGAGDVNGDGYDDVIVGAELYDAGQTNEGAAFVFHGGPSGIANSNPATAATQLEANQSTALFGTSVAGAGDVNGDGYDDVIVGAQEYDNGQTNEGGAFIFHGGPSGIADASPSTANTRLESNQAGSFFGGSVAGAGDVNGDGYDDVIVGCEQWSGPTIYEGAAFVFHGGASGIAHGNPTTANAQIESDQLGAYLGVRVAGAGDVNGDGYDDVIVGAEAYDAPTADEGAAWIFHGSSSGIVGNRPNTAATQLESNQADAFFGGAVAGAGDVNGDGYDDVIVGAEFYDDGTLNEGAAFIFHGSASGVASGNPATAATQLEANQGSSAFGSGVAGAGDVNGDGYDDVIVGAPQYDAPTSDEGAAFVFLGGPGGIPDGDPTTADFQLESDQGGATLGTVAGAGDVNGDGYDDVIVGADTYDNGQTDEGAAFVYLIPEPSEVLLLTTALAFLALLGRRRLSTPR